MMTKAVVGVGVCYLLSEEQGKSDKLQALRESINYRKKRATLNSSTLSAPGKMSKFADTSVATQ